MRKTTAILVLVAITVFTSAAYYVFQADWVSFRKGEHSFARGNFREAVDYYAASLQAGLKTPVLLTHLIESYFALGDNQEAVAVLKDFISEYPDKTDALFTLGSYCLRAGLFDEAAGVYRHILKKAPGNEAARLYLARSLTWEGRLEKAINEYRILLGEI